MCIRDRASTEPTSAPLPNSNQPPPSHNETPPVHFGWRCDQCDMAPIIGTRYHFEGTDLCEADFEKLPELERLKFEKPPADVPVEFQCDSCTSWFNLASEGITIAMLRDRVFDKLLCTECKMTAKTNSSPISPLRAEPKEEASATINPQPFSPISSPFPSTSHNSKPVSSPHSDIIPMAQEQISPVVKMGKRNSAMYKRKPFGSKLSAR